MLTESKIPISKSVLALLSPEERALFTKIISLKVKELKLPSIPYYIRFKDKIEEYFLKNYMSCHCCGEEWIEWYLMKEDKEKNILEAEKIQDPMVVKFKERKGFVNTCISCKRNLRKLEKEDLITKLIFTCAIKIRGKKERKIK
jgi:hypothetical protein